MIGGMVVPQDTILVLNSYVVVPQYWTMYKLLCGPRDETEITGILGELGYTSNQVYKF